MGATMPSALWKRAQKSGTAADFVPRTFGPDRLRSVHYVPILGRKPRALRNGAPFKDWVLSGALEKVRRKLKGVDDGDRQMVDILAAALTECLPAVETACAEAIAQGVHSVGRSFLVGHRRGIAGQDIAQAGLLTIGIDHGPHVQALQQGPAGGVFGQLLVRDARPDSPHVGLAQHEPVDGDVAKGAERLSGQLPP